MTQVVRDYLGQLVRISRSVFQDDVRAVLVGGSLALDDFHPHMSDVDVTLLVGKCPSSEQLSTMARRLDHHAMPCPGTGLDLMAFTCEVVRTPPSTPQALFGFVTGQTWKTELTGPEASADFLLDLFVLRAQGWSLYGPAPRDLVGDIDAAMLVPLLVRVVRWHRTRIHDPFHDPTGACAVLNACRAWRFLDEGIMGSKTAGGEWALARGRDLPAIADALAVRRGDGDGRLDKRHVLHVLDVVAEEMVG